MGAWKQTENNYAAIWAMTGLFGIGANSLFMLLDKNKYVKFMPFHKKVFYLPQYLIVLAVIFNNYLPFLIIISLMANFRAFLLFTDYFFVIERKRIIDFLI